MALTDAAVSRQKQRTVPGESVRESVYANIAGQFRTVFANLLWMKADGYHHEFVEHNTNWAQDSDIIPLMRLITWLDPHFTQAYSSGAWMLGFYQKRSGYAKAFLSEGIGNNPDSSELYETLGYIDWRIDRNPPAALQNFIKAANTASSAFDKERLLTSVRALRQRVKEGYIPEPFRDANPGAAAKSAGCQHPHTGHDH